jgi:hypothetical protein
VHSSSRNGWVCIDGVWQAAAAEAPDAEMQAEMQAYMKKMRIGPTVNPHMGRPTSARSSSAATTGVPRCVAPSWVRDSGQGFESAGGALEGGEDGVGCTTRRFSVAAGQPVLWYCWGDTARWWPFTRVSGRRESDHCALMTTTARVRQGGGRCGRRGGSAAGVGAGAARGQWNRARGG